MRHTTLLATMLTACATAVTPEDLPSSPPDSSPAPLVVDDVAMPPPPFARDVSQPAPDRALALDDAGAAHADGAAAPVAADARAGAGAGLDNAAPADVPRGNRRVLVITLDEESQRACGPHGWTLVTWDPAGVELPPSDPGAPLRVELPWAWRGLLGVGMRCESGYPAFYRDLSPHLGDVAASAGFRAITLDGRDVASRTRVCDPPWVRAAHPDWPVAWRVVALVPLETALGGVCPT